MSARFDPAPGGPGLGQRVVAGGLAIVSARLGSQVVRIALTAVLARILTPDDYGVVAVVLAISGFGLVLQDLGLSASTVQRESVTAPQLSALFWLNVGFGLLLAIVGMSAAPLIAGLMSRADAEPLVMALFAGMLLPSLSAQHRALLQRQMRFGEQALIGIIGLVVGGACAVAIAVAGGGAWALVALGIGSDLVTMLLSWRAVRFMPGRFRWDVATGAMVRFGTGFLMFRVLGYLAQNLHALLLGSTAGVAQAGFYSRAHSTADLLLGYTNEPARKLATSTLPRCTADPLEFARVYQRFLAVMMAIAAPIAAFTWLSSDDLIRLLLGPQWTTVGPLLGVLAIGMAVQPALSSTGWIYLARGEIRGMVAWGVFGWGVMIGGALIGMRWGATGIAWSWTLALYLLLLPCLWAACKGTQIRIGASLALIARPIGAAGAATAIGWPLHVALAEGTAIVRLLACALLFGVSYLALACTLFGQRELIADIVAALRRQKRLTPP